MYDSLRLCDDPDHELYDSLRLYDDPDHEFVSGSVQPLMEFAPTSQALQWLDPVLYDRLRLCDHRAMSCATVSGFAETVT